MKKEAAKDGVPGEMGPGSAKRGQMVGRKNQVTDVGKKSGFRVPAQTGRV